MRLAILLIFLSGCATSHDHSHIEHRIDRLMLRVLSAEAANGETVDAIGANSDRLDLHSVDLTRGNRINVRNRRRLDDLWIRIIRAERLIKPQELIELKAGLLPEGGAPGGPEGDRRVPEPWGEAR